MTFRKTIGLVAALAVLLLIAAGAIFLFDLWRSFHTGSLLPARALAGPNTIALFSVTVKRDDSGVVATLAHLKEMDQRRKQSRLPSWARWLLAGGGTDAPSAQAAALMPLRVLTFVDMKKGDADAAGALVVSLSRYSDRIASALGSDPLRRHNGIAIAPPANSGDPYSALVRNNVVLSRDESALRKTIDRILGGAERPGPLFERAVGDLSEDGDGFGVVLNPGDALESMAREALARHGVEIKGGETSGRLIPYGLLGSGFSIDLVSPDEAHLVGEIFFSDPQAADKASRWVRRGLPVALAFFGLESEFRARREGEVLRIDGTMRALDALWDRLLAGRLFGRVAMSEGGAPARERSRGRTTPRRQR